VGRRRLQALPSGGLSNFTLSTWAFRVCVAASEERLLLFHVKKARVECLRSCTSPRDPCLSQSSEPVPHIGKGLPTDQFPSPQNGDYNKPIPAQYMEHLNHVVSSAPSPRDPTQPQQWVSSQVLLCRKCSHHQTTKIKQLAAFSPREEVSA
jgi:hypothetical protein